MNITKKNIHLYASPKAVIINFLHLPGTDRITNILTRITVMDEEEVGELLEKVMDDFGKRHRDIKSTFLQHFERVAAVYKGDLSNFSAQRKLLTGSFFSKEYSVQAAALFNPSIVPHPNQEGLNNGEQRFIMSLRSTGEGHISSLVFKTGIVNKSGDIWLDNDTGYHTCLQKDHGAKLTRGFVKQCASSISGFDDKIIDLLPEMFTAEEANEILNSIKPIDLPALNSVVILKNILDSNYKLASSSHIPLNEKVIFPTAQVESMGIEDVRLVKFSDNGQSCYYGTYTAYNGREIKIQLIETKDFDTFRICTLNGAAIADKGMALFPEKINGKYVMISRQGGEKMNIMFSDDLYRWDDFKVLMEPFYPWEIVQLGNCGSPVKTSKGWLLLTHAVGPMRTYVISAILLDLKDPSKIIGRLDKPLIEANEEEREGYVPNVVYTCGLMQHEDILVIPYAVSDSATAFATISIDEILNELLKK